MVPTTRHGSSPVATESGGGEKWPRTKSGESERSIAVSQSPRLATNSQTRCLADSSGRTLAAVSGRVKWRRAWNPACGAASSRRAAAQVRQVVDAQTLGDFPQPGSAGGEESAQQPARGQLLQPTLPVLGVAPQPLEDPGQLTGDRGFAFAEHPPGVLHQKQVIAQRESFEHPTSPGPRPDPAAPAGANEADFAVDSLIRYCASCEGMGQPAFPAFPPCVKIPPEVPYARYDHALRIRRRHPPVPRQGLEDAGPGSAPGSLPRVGRRRDHGAGWRRLPLHRGRLGTTKRIARRGGGADRAKPLRAARCEPFIGSRQGPITADIVRRARRGRGREWARVPRAGGS